MKRTASVIGLVLMGSLLAASDVLGGAGGLAPAGKTVGPAVTAAVVIDVTGVQNALGKGVATVRVQRASSSSAVLFQSGMIHSWIGQCFALAFPDDLVASTNFRFVGLMTTWVDTPAVLAALVGQFGDPTKAAITDTDYAACTTENGRQILSFTAVIQFQP